MGAPFVRETIVAKYPVFNQPTELRAFIRLLFDVFYDHQSGQNHFDHFCKFRVFAKNYNLISEIYCTKLSHIHVFVR